MGGINGHCPATCKPGAKSQKSSRYSTYARGSDRTYDENMGAPDSVVARVEQMRTMLSLSAT